MNRKGILDAESLALGFVVQTFELQTVFPDFQFREVMASIVPRRYESMLRALEFRKRMPDFGSFSRRTHLREYHPIPSLAGGRMLARRSNIMRHSRYWIRAFIALIVGAQNEIYAHAFAQSSEGRGDHKARRVTESMPKNRFMCIDDNPLLAPSLRIS